MVFKLQQAQLLADILLQVDEALHLALGVLVQLGAVVAAGKDVHRHIHQSLMVLGVAMPIMIQNGITNFVSLLDNIMVGQVGTEQMSGVAIVNQLLFIYNL